MNFTIHAIIGLPRDTFKAVGTTAKTAILYLEKRPSSQNHQVLLAEVTKVNLNGEARLNADDNPQLMAVLESLKKR